MFDVRHNVSWDPDLQPYYLQCFRLAPEALRPDRLKAEAGAETGGDLLRGQDDDPGIRIDLLAKALP
ncbi:MAG: hypothetical protein Tsb0019_09300 [Roseibium sp.]